MAKCENSVVAKPKKVEDLQPKQFLPTARERVSGANISLIMMLFDDFLPSKTAIFVVKNNMGQTDGPTDAQIDGRTQPLIEIRSCI